MNKDYLYIGTAGTALLAVVDLGKRCFYETTYPKEYLKMLNNPALFYAPKPDEIVFVSTNKELRKFEKGLIERGFADKTEKEHA